LPTAPASTTPPWAGERLEVAAPASTTPPWASEHSQTKQQYRHWSLRWRAPRWGDYTNATAIGYGASLTASNSIVLGNDSITAIYAQVSTITGVSDRRRKKDITALDSDLGLNFIEKLQPVSYRFNNGDETERYGFIAQDLVLALPASLHETIERSEPKHGLALIERQNDEDRTYRISYGELLAPNARAVKLSSRSAQLP
jgi:hypothetical protein